MAKTKKISIDQLKWLVAQQGVVKTAVENISQRIGTEDQELELANLQYDKTFFNWNNETWSAMMKMFDYVYHGKNFGPNKSWKRYFKAINLMEWVRNGHKEIKKRWTANMIDRKKHRQAKNRNSTLHRMQSQEDKHNHTVHIRYPQLCIAVPDFEKGWFKRAYFDCSEINRDELIYIKNGEQFVLPSFCDLTQFHVGNFILGYMHKFLGEKEARIYELPESLKIDGELLPPVLPVISEQMLLDLVKAKKKIIALDQQLRQLHETIKSKWHLRKESDQISLNLAESIPQSPSVLPLPMTNKAAEKTAESTLKAHEKKLRKEFGKIFPHK